MDSVDSARCSKRIQPQKAKPTLGVVGLFIPVSCLLIGCDVKYMDSVPISAAFEAKTEFHVYVFLEFWWYLEKKTHIYVLFSSVGWNVCDICYQTRAYLQKSNRIDDSKIDCVVPAHHISGVQIFKSNLKSRTIPRRRNETHNASDLGAAAVHRPTYGTNICSF